jgi:hypothetical protein
MQRTLLFRLLPLLLTLVACAEVTDADLPPLTEPGQWRYITQHEASTTSRCIGQPNSPLCAVETLLACFQRDAIELCRMVDDGTEQYSQIFAAPADPSKYLAYRVIGADRKSDDVLITLDQREGLLGRYAKSTGAPVQSFTLKRQAEGVWKVTAWGDVGE